MNKEQNNIQKESQESIENTTKNYNRIPLVFDIDDVVLDSCQAIIDIINSKYDLMPRIEEKDINDWDFTYLRREIKRQKGIELYTQDLLKLFETEEFWERVNIKQGFLEIVCNKAIQENFRIALVSVGTDINLKLKREFLYNSLNMQDIMFLGLPLDLEKPKYTKREIEKILPLWKGIQIDDNYECLNTNAKLKILLKNNKETSYNQVVDIREDLYIINDLNELKDILIFITKANNEFFEDFVKIPFV